LEDLRLLVGFPVREFNLPSQSISALFASRMGGRKLTVTSDIFIQKFSIEYIRKCQLRVTRIRDGKVYDRGMSRELGLWGNGVNLCGRGSLGHGGLINGSRRQGGF